MFPRTVIVVPLLAALAFGQAATRAQRRGMQRVMDSFIAAMNRHDVDAQHSLYAADMFYLDGGRRGTPNKEHSRRDREFEAANQAQWSYRLLAAPAADTLEMVVTEDMEFYQLLGVGARSHHARYRFRDGKITQVEAWDWTQTGCRYEARRNAFVAWLKSERPEAAGKLTKDGGLTFAADTAPLLNQFVREWATANPCVPSSKSNQH